MKSKFVTMNDRDNTDIHENVAYWIASITDTNLHSDRQYHLNINMMTANGVKTINLFYTNEEQREYDRAELMEWLKDKK